MKIQTLFILCFFTIALGAQDLKKSPWHIQAQDINPNNYFGVTVATKAVIKYRISLL